MSDDDLDALMRDRPIMVVDDDLVAPPGSVLVCGQGMFSDDVAATCAHCHAGIMHRPMVPAGLIKLCIRCARSHLATFPDARNAVTRRTIDEVRLHRAKPRGSA